VVRPADSNGRPSAPEVNDHILSCVGSVFLPRWSRGIWPIRRHLGRHLGRPSSKASPSRTLLDSASAATLRAAARPHGIKGIPGKLSTADSVSRGASEVFESRCSRRLTTETTNDSAVKLLDFGLASMAQGAEASPGGAFSAHSCPIKLEFSAHSKASCKRGVLLGIIVNAVR
jgi:hypothetical protein